jgi:hypothetical protein
MLAFLFAGGSTLTARAQDDATPAAEEGDATDMVATYRAQTRLQESIFGPERGSLTHDAEVITYAPAGVKVRNFFAKIRVTAPYSGDEQLWDAGFTFRSGRDADWRVVIYSDGSWDFRIGSGDPIQEGAIEDLKTDEGDTNDLELAVDGDTGYFAVNGTQVGSFDLTARNVAGDVAFGVTFVDNAVKVGAETPYSRFQVWQLEDSAPDDVSRDARDLMEEGRDFADTEDPAGGPYEGELDETEKSVTVHTLGVEVVDLYVKAEVANPRDGEEHPFDFGFGLRDAGGDVQYRLIFASDGSWYVKLGVDPAIAAENFEGLNTGEGETNLIEAVASGDDLVFAVNGDIVGTADISELSDPGDVAFGVGFYPDEDIVEGALTAVADFTVWDLSGGSAEPTEESETPEATETEEAETPEATETEEQETPEATETEEAETPEATETEEAETPESDDPEDIADFYLDRTDSLEILYGPESGDLDHQSDSITYVDTRLDVKDFVLHVEFVNPYDASEENWDVGVLFRLGDEDPHLRLIITSLGDWYLTPGTGDPLQDGTVRDLNVNADESNSLDLIVVGETGYFLVNDEFVDELDLSADTQSGDLGIATSFFQGNFQDGATTGYEDFIVWSLDDSGGPEPTEEGGDETPEAGGLYESPTYGYTVAYDDPWTITDEESNEDADRVRFSDDVSTVDLWGFETDFTPEECLEDEFNYYKTQAGYTNAQVAIDTEDNEMTGQIDDFVWGVYWFTYQSDEESDPIDYTSYVECHPLDDGVMLRIVQFVEFDDYNDEIENRVALLEGLDLDGGGSSEGGDETATPEDEETPTDEETPESDGDVAVVQIEATSGSAVTGIATVEEDGSRSTVRVLALGADDGTVAVIQAGTCDELSGEAEFDLEPIEGGLSETTVRVDFGELTSGDYVITFHESEDDLGEALACGVIES